jgi:hypothetical protein
VVTAPFPRHARARPTGRLLREFSDDARLIASEPLGDVAGVWNEVPESTCCVMSHDQPRCGHPTHDAVDLHACERVRTAATFTAALG